MAKKKSGAARQGKKPRRGTARKGGTDRTSAAAKMGRPTKYDPKFAQIAASMCALGATDRDLAEAFGVTTVTVWNWQATHAEFFNALRVGKGTPDDKVERSLYQRAVGYTFHTEKIFHHRGKITRAEAIEHVPPDPGACKLWLCNRRPEEWREKFAAELVGKDGKDLIPEREHSPRDLARAVIDILRCARIAAAPEPDAGNGRHNSEAEAPTPPRPIARFNAQTGRLEHDA